MRQKLWLLDSNNCYCNCSYIKVIIAVTGFPTWAGNWAGRGGSDPITIPIKAQKKLPAQLPALEKKNYQPYKNFRAGRGGNRAGSS